MKFLFRKFAGELQLPCHSMCAVQVFLTLFPHSELPPLSRL